MARTWVPRDAIRLIRTRLQKLTSTRSSSAELRILPDAIIGRGITEGTSDSQVRAGSVSIAQSVKSQTVGIVVSQAGIFSRIQQATATVSLSAKAELGPTLVKDDIRYSFNHGSLQGDSSAQLAPFKITKERLNSLEGRVDLSMKYARVQKVRGVSICRAEGLGGFSTYVQHVFNERLQVSSFSYLGPFQYRLLWVDGVCAPAAVINEEFVNLRWIGMTALGVGTSSTSGRYRRYASAGTSLTVAADSVGTSYVKRGLPKQTITATVEGQAVGGRHAYLGGVSIAEALYGPVVNSYAVKWVGHATYQQTGATAFSSGSTPSRIVRTRAVDATLVGIADMTPVRQRLVISADNGMANSQNLIAPIRIAIMQHKGEGVVRTSMDNNALVVYHHTYWNGLIQPTALTEAQGLKEVTIETLPTLQGNAAMFRVGFKINADAPAPYSRQIIVPWVDRGMFVPATNREYRV